MGTQTFCKKSSRSCRQYTRVQTNKQTRRKGTYSNGKIWLVKLLYNIFSKIRYISSEQLLLWMIFVQHMHGSTQFSYLQMCALNRRKYFIVKYTHGPKRIKYAYTYEYCFVLIAILSWWPISSNQHEHQNISAIGNDFCTYGCIQLSIFTLSYLFQ